MGFDAGNVVEALDWDFRPHMDASGTIPEPSEKQVRTFFKVVQDSREVLKAALDSEDAGPEVERVNNEFLDALADLCSGSPSREQIEALPARVQIAFGDWLSRELSDPTKAAGIRPPLRAVN